MKHTRAEILRVLLDNVPAAHTLIGIPYMAIPVDRTAGDETENTRLIEDLEMDSLDIQTMVCQAAEELGMDIYSVPDEQIDYLYTLGDCVTLIQRFED